MVRIRLSKAIAAAGIVSRRGAEDLIFKGKVYVNGQKVVLPQTMVDMEQDTIVVEGKKIGRQASYVYYALHKPVGYQCTNAKEIKRRAIDLIEAPPGVRLFTVGRLDKDTSGLILVTNDGQLANRIIHPSGEVKKEYIAKVDQEISHDHLVTLSQGCAVEGILVRPARVTKIRRGTVRIVVQEGRRHEVRKMLESAGLRVIELKRVKIGDLNLGTLPVGQWKELSQNEVLRLFPRHEGSSTRPCRMPHSSSHSRK